MCIKGGREGTHRPVEPVGLSNLSDGSGHKDEKEGQNGTGKWNRKMEKSQGHSVYLSASGGLGTDLARKFSLPHFLSSGH